MKCFKLVRLAVQPRDEERNITFQNGILKDFEPRFKSIDKDHKRYFDALVDLSEQGIIEADEVLKCSGPGALWITFQYIDNGLLDIVEANLKSGVTCRDFHGPLFENTRLTLDRLLEISETHRVISIYRAAIKHRLKAMQGHAVDLEKTRKKQTPKAKSKYIRHYLRPLKNLLKDYKAVLADSGQSDPEVEDFATAVQGLELIQQGKA